MKWIFQFGHHMNGWESAIAGIVRERVCGLTWVTGEAGAQALSLLLGLRARVWEGRRGSVR